MPAELAVKDDAQLLGQEKRALRRELLATRAALAPACGSAAAQAVARAIAEQVAAQPRCAAARCDALYAPLEGELDPGPLGALLRGRGAVVCYPRVASQVPPRLEFHVVPDAACLLRGTYGVREPAVAAPL